MKLCPQCEFIYEDDQNLCDMDGETLVNDTRAGVMPGTLSAITVARPAKSRLKIIAMPLVAGLVLSALLFIAYCASSPLLYSEVAAPIETPEAKVTGLQQQFASQPDAAKSQPDTPSQPTNPVVASESVNSGADESATKAVSESARNQRVPKATSEAPKASDNRLTIARGLPPLRQLTPLPRLSPPRRLSERTGSNQKAVVVEVKPLKGTANKRSKVTTLLKKTARLLKKPFRF